MESGDKNCASCNWSIGNNKEGIRSEPSVAPRSQVDYSATKDHTNEHCTQHSVSAGVHPFDLLLRS